MYARSTNCCEGARLDARPVVAQVSCLALSRSGKYLASGQITYMGFTADIIIWDLETKQLLHRMALHKVGALWGVSGAGAGGGARACRQCQGCRPSAGERPRQGSAHASQVKVQALDFSPDERFLASLGGQDDNALVRTEVEAAVHAGPGAAQRGASPTHSATSLGSCGYSDSYWFRS